MSGSQTAIRPLVHGDALAFVRFVASVSEGDRRFLKEDLSDPIAAFQGFLRDDASRRFAAVDQNNDIVGLAGAHPESGWSSHVAELRVVVSSESRQRGIGRLLAQTALIEALRRGCTHVFVEVVAEQEQLVVMFQSLGFEPEALLRDFVRDSRGDLFDLMILTHRVGDQLATQQLLGLDEAVG